MMRTRLNIESLFTPKPNGKESNTQIDGRELSPFARRWQQRNKPSDHKLVDGPRELFYHGLGLYSRTSPTKRQVGIKNRDFLRSVPVAINRPKFGSL